MTSCHRFHSPPKGDRREFHVLQVQHDQAEDRTQDDPAQTGDSEQYLRFLHDNPAEPAALCEDILIHVTGFFREPAAFQALAEGIFPKILENKPPGESIRIWVLVVHGRRGVLHRHGPAECVVIA